MTVRDPVMKTVPGSETRIMWLSFIFWQYPQGAGMRELPKRCSPLSGTALRAKLKQFGWIRWKTIIPQKGCMNALDFTAAEI